MLSGREEAPAERTGLAAALRGDPRVSGDGKLERISAREDRRERGSARERISSREDQRERAILI
jgi:hypothetical protein